MTIPRTIAGGEPRVPPGLLVDAAFRAPGPAGTIMAAGPCSVTEAGRTLRVAEAVAAGGATWLRGGAYKPRTSPNSFQGLGEDGLKMLADARRATGLPVVTEVLDVRDVELVAAYADVLQIGARNMQNAPLLIEVGRAGRPVLLKRHFAATIAEVLGALEYVRGAGNERVILCERGIRTFAADPCRFTLDIAAVPVLKQLAGVPVFVDPSHAAGRRDLVLALSKAAVAAGADGLLVEVDESPDQALSDGPQQLRSTGFAAYMCAVGRVAAAEGRPLVGAG